MRDYESPFEPPQITREILSVSQLNRRARQLLEIHLPLLWVEGEVSNFSRPSSGHWYFTLKDDSAQVRCAMFRNRNQALRQTPQQGQQVLVRARVSLYEGRGDYQLIVEHLEAAGFGALQRAFEQLRQKLLQEGLFDPQHKQPIPLLPQHIGIITSPTGAALRDILHVLKRRFPAIPVSLFPVAVQGSEAAGQIVAALDTANRLSDCDILILARGGGSLEDLWPFNEESVARAIFQSRIPIVSGVGHETDTSIADFVADLRAPTPSAAAELCTPDRHELLQQLLGYEEWLQKSQSIVIRDKRQQLLSLSSRLQHPSQRLQARAQHLDNLEIRLRQSITAQLRHAGSQLLSVAARCQRQNPTVRISAGRVLLEQWSQRLAKGMQQRLADKQRDLGKQAALLESNSPLGILQRGYSVTQKADGQVVRQSSDLIVGETLVTRLADGQVDSVISKIK